MFKLPNLIKKHSFKLLTFVGLFLLVPKIAFAQATGGFFSLALDSVWDIVLGIVSMIVDFFGSFLITLAGSIVNYVFSFQSFATVPVVQIGWTISRDLANMFFILIMLLIAFGTVLRLESYGWKKLILKLVTAALLINFSLIICAAVIDFGNTVSRFFITGGNTSKELDVSASILSSLRAGTIAQLRNNVSGNSPVTSLIMASIGQLIMYVVIAFVLLAYAGVMISRLIKLWIYIIVSPLVWVSSAMPGIGIPGASNHFSEWWKKFFNLAVFFPVSISFFLMLGLIAGSTFNSLEQNTIQAVSGSNFNSIKAAGGFWETLFPSTGFSVVMQFVIVIGILWYGLEQAKASGTYGGKLVVGWAESTKKWAEGKVKAGIKAIPGTAMKTVDRKTGGAVSKGIDRGIERLETMPGVGRMIGGPGARFQRQQKELKNAEGKLKGLRPQDLRAILNQVSITPEGQARRAAALSQLADKGQLKDEDKKHIQDFQAAGGNIKDLLERRLDWAFDEMIQGMMAKDFNFPAVSEAWKKVAEEASDSTARFQAAAKAIQDIIPKKPEDLANLQKEAIIGGIGTHQAKIKELITEEFKEINSITGKSGRLYGASLNSMINKNPAAFQELIEYLKQDKVLNTLREDVQNTIKFKPFYQAMTQQQTPTVSQPAAATPP
ncbi:MAG: hypothetical protein AAB394_01945 [Patescibacteria group bacterium]